MGSVPLKRVSGIAKALKILVPIIGVLALISALLAGLAREDARDYLANRIDEDEFLEAYGPSVLVGLAQGAAMIAVVVLTMIWMHRLASNHRQLGRTGTWGPGWAVAGWFLPPMALYIIPFLMFRELWKASDSGITVGDERWKTSAVNPIVVVWWIVYGLVLPGLSFGQGIESVSGGFGGNDSENLAETIDEQYALTVAVGLATLVAAIAYFLLIRGLTERHERLTGEASTRR
jgi:hypothetical protein